MPKSLTIMLCDSPFQHESVDKAIEIAQTALRKGHRVNIFLMMDGVYNPVTTQSGAPFNVSSISERMAELIKNGARIAACRVCMELRGVKAESIPEGLDEGGIYDLSEMIANSDVVISLIGRT